MPIPSGTRLGQYEILAPLGKGGMGEVYRARDTRLGREIALKVLPTGAAADPERLAWFEREARTVAALNHPNIVILHTVEDVDGVRFLTMELVDGRSLAQALADGPLAPERVIELGIALSDALAAAHERGVVHRDLKPANVMLTRDGRLKVLDFGLAKLDRPGGEVTLSQLDTNVASISGQGRLVGTVPYMAPEQLRGESADARTDLFALGVVLYELAAGARPFGGATVADISSAILRDAPRPLVAVRGDLPSDLDRIVSRLLEKQPRDRWQTALDVGNELRRARLTREGGIAAPTALPPTPATALVGRESLLDAATERLRAGARLLTVTGYGGTGKTRFAIELFRRVANGYAGGAAFVSLAAVTDASEVLTVVAAGLEIAEAHGRTPLEALAAVIGDRSVLLVLDNLEQVLEAAGDLATLVARCARLQVVATSRAPLRIGAESEFALPPLELPPDGVVTPEALAACPAVALLVQRAEKVKPGFALDASNAATIAAICRRLDGLPLALELAAARIRVLEPAALLQRLDRALDLLTSGDRDLPLRQRTLRATISWSYSLLDADEQRLLRRLSVFHEGWTLEGMEQVCFGEGDRSEALDRLESLVEKGLVRVTSGSDRYALLETIRAFANGQLHAGGETDATRRAHARHFTAVALAVGEDFFSPRQLDAMRRARADLANLHAALAWLVELARGGDTDAREQALLLAGGMDWYWHVTGLHLTAREWMDAVLELAKDAPPSRGRALSYLAAGMVSTTTGEWDRSLAEWAAGYEDANATGFTRAAAEGRMGMAYCHLATGRMDEAAEHLAASLALCAGGACEYIRGLATTLEGMRLFSTGHVDEGMAKEEEAIRIEASIDDHEIRGLAMSFLAQMTFAKGEHGLALERYRVALEHMETVGDLPEIARIHTEMGWTALSVGDTSAGRRAFQLGVRANEVIGSARGIGAALLGLAAIEAAEGRTERAVSIAAAADAWSKRVGVVIAHPMAPGLAERIEALKASIPRGQLDGLVAGADALTPEAVLAMVAKG